MNVEIRIYKLFDTDLLALVDNGYPVCEMMKSAVINYANGTPISYQVDEHLFFDANRKKNVRLRFSVSDHKTVQLLNNIKHGYRNAFCKMLLRDSLSRLNIGCYFADESMLDLQSQSSRSNPIPVSSLRIRARGKAIISPEPIAPKQTISEPVPVSIPINNDKPKPSKVPSPLPAKSSSGDDILDAFNAL